ISQEKNRLRWLERQRRKFEGYIKRQEAAIAELDRRRQELDRINRELEPYLEEVVDRLAAFIETDLDFLAEERTRRLDFLRQSLGDYHLGLSEKLRRTLEALQVEAAYGHNLDQTEAELTIDGQPTQVHVLRLGRLALYYQTLDGQKLGWRPRGALKWRPLSRGYRRELAKALDMAQRRRAVELVTLPVGRPQP
ncbi:MAG: DUF3450 domain-containing protein, partial [Deltaproteobacteria bacterium]|nr:DUF3450 domain-containing protein [Deltaproteobacteria bacterium]